MNVNGLIMTLQNTVNYPVAPDLYEGKEDKYITFTYEDERSAWMPTTKNSRLWHIYRLHCILRHCKSTWKIRKR